MIDYIEKEGGIGLNTVVEKSFATGLELFCLLMARSAKYLLDVIVKLFFFQF